MSKNKTTKAASSGGTKCTSTCSGGAFRCVLEGPHTTHSTKTKRGGQFSTWTPLPSGKVHVTSHDLKGKKMGEWDEDAARCDAFRSGAWHEPARCGLVGGHAGDHTAEVVVAEDWPEAGQTRRIAWDKFGIGKGNDILEDAAAPTAAQADAVQGDVSAIFDGAVEDSGHEHLICGYPRHPAAALFQLLEGEHLTALADSIEANGQREPIVLITVGGKTSILDGSNRGVACELRGIKPRFAHYEGPKDMASLIAYSMDKNKHRRHQEPSVLAMVAVDAGQLLGRGNPGDRETGRSAGLLTQAEAGKKLGISERLVRKAKAVHDKGTPKLNDAVRKGKIKVDAAEQVAKLPAAKQDELADKALAKAGETKSGHIRALVRQEARRDVVAKINRGQVPAIAELTGQFGLMLWDPPWEYENSDDHVSARGHIKYPSMSLEQLVELGREALAKLRDEAVIVTWATNPRMPVAVHLIEALGLTWQSMGTWVKSQIGMGPLNMRSRTEHYIVATRGKPVHTLNEVSTWLADRPLDRTSEHSEKPDELHVLLERHCSGPFLELFARGPREGWTTWGAEAEKFASEAA